MLTVFLPALLLTLLLAVPAAAQPIRHTATPDAPLAERWEAAQRDGQGMGGAYLVGYSVERRMDAHSYMLAGYRDGWEGRPSLHQVLYGRPAPDEQADDAGDDVQAAARRALAHREARRGEQPKVRKALALLYRFDARGTLQEVDVTNLSKPYDPDGAPLFWLGPAADDQSLALLTARYRDAASADEREELMMPIGIHDAPDRVVPLLDGVLTRDASEDVREQAAFWLGQTDAPQALAALQRTIARDASEDVREHAVFAVSQMDLIEATESLIALARSATDTAVREKAIFWLGQKASERAVAALRDVVFDDDETAVQEQAVFALSQLPPDQGVPLLVDVARTHRNPDVRKKAIFWLGQSGDPRAVEVLAELVRQ